MATHTLTLTLPDDIEARIFYTPNPWGTHAHGIAFDAEAQIIADRESINYNGYCLACIAYDVLADMLATRRRIEHADVWNALESEGHTCTCEADEDTTTTLL